MASSAIARKSAGASSLQPGLKQQSFGPREHLSFPSLTVPALAPKGYGPATRLREGDKIKGRGGGPLPHLVLS